MKKTTKRILIIVSAFVLVLIILAISALIWYNINISAINGEKCNGDNCPKKTITVSKGSVADIADQLEKEGIIRSALAFRIYMALNGKSATLKTGEYEFRLDMSVEEIIKALSEGAAAKTIRITFLPGDTAVSAKQRIVKAGYSEADVEAAFAKQYDHELLKTKPASASLEGYIWGETYDFYATATVEDILTRIFDEMLKVVKKEDLVARYQAHGLSLHEGITLASIIQRESPDNYDEKRHVAQVFQTRIKDGIPLGSDAVIAYAADQINPDRDKNDMSYLTSIQCPWNSRRCKGLPPTPIATPGLNSLKAAADPTDTNDYYFLTGDDGKMYYAKTEAEHNANARKYCQKMCQIL